MKERNARLRAVKKLISENRVTSQEQLLGLLSGRGISVTQATLSRDMKSLKVNKVFDGDRGYYYTLPSEENPEDTIPHYVQDIRRGFLSMEFSGNICVINTLSGHANPVAAALDRLSLEDIVGTVAGDDTIMAVLKENVAEEQFRRDFEKLLEVK
jgi:transcriptional regulator of arginine metabolism